MFRLSEIFTANGSLMSREFGPRGSDTAVLMVGGVGGGFDSPAKDLYGRLGDALPSESMSALHLKYRDPKSLPGCVDDVLAGIHFLRVHGVSRVVLIGHSMGGAAVVNAALRSSEVAAVCTISTQLGGMGDLGHLNAPILFIHGTDDDVLPAACSVSAWKLAREPRRLELIDGASHTLDENADEVFSVVNGWLMDQLRPEAVAAK